MDATVLPVQVRSEPLIEHGARIRDYIRAGQLAEMAHTNVELTNAEYGFLLRTIRVLWDTLALSDPLAIAAVATKYASFFAKV